MTVRFWYLGKGLPWAMTTFEEIRLEIEGTLAAAQEAENKRFLLRRVHRLITLADEAIYINDKRSPVAANLATRTHLATLRSLVKNCDGRCRAKEWRPKVTGKPDAGGVSLQISILQTGDFAILGLRGRWTIEGGENESLKGHLQELVVSGVRKFLLNLADLTQIDSSGVSSIVKTYRSLRDQGCDLRLLCPSGHAREVFKVLHLLEMIPSFENEDLAVASFKPLGDCANA
jgi:anti-anti-sigma factor